MTTEVISNLNGVANQLDPGILISGLEQPETIHVGSIGIREVGRFDYSRVSP